jgi:hypothetical protein
MEIVRRPHNQSVIRRLQNNKQATTLSEKRKSFNLESLIRLFTARKMEKFFFFSLVIFNAIAFGECGERFRSIISESVPGRVTQESKIFENNPDDLFLNLFSVIRRKFHFFSLLFKATRSAARPMRPSQGTATHASATLRGRTRSAR